MSLLTHESPAASWRAHLSERWRALRDRLVSSPVFRRRAAAFALTRPIARRRAREVFDLVAGFVYSQVLLACVRLHLFEMLAEGPQTTAALAKRMALPLESAQRLLAAAVSLRLVEARGADRFGLGALGAPLLGNAGILAMVEHHAALYADLADPVELLRAAPGDPRRGALADYWPYADAGVDAPIVRETTPTLQTAAAHDARVARYSALMAASQPLVSDEILDAYSLRRHRCLLDVGGGDGSFVVAAAQRHPVLQLMLFDLPPVAELARARLASARLAGRARVTGGSFLHDELPRGADVASLVRVVHDHDDRHAMQILRAVRRCLPDDGSLLLAEPMSQTLGAQAMGDAYFGFYLLAMGRGRPRSATELSHMLRAAGFASVRQIPTHMPLQTQLLVARCSA